MKRIYTLLLLTMLTLSINAQPILCGHRGSLWGVENTSEAFINGAKKGYKYLECDVKVTGDGEYIISHDDNTSRLGGNLTIASATLAQLKAETYTQTRGGVKYTGQICTVAEYLQICKDHNVKPLIELKWATGINNNDCSKIPGLISLIDNYGFKQEAIILTSMKPCLEYIRTNYPEVELQFLTGQYWASHFDWCVQWKIDADIQAGYFDKSTVTRYHEEGLKVGVWTVDDNGAYRTYGNYGCDFITVNSLDPATVPDLDEVNPLVPNTVDYPENRGIVQPSYTPELISNISTPDVLDGLTVKRVLLHNSKYYVLALGTGNTPNLYVINPETGDVTQMSTNGIDHGTVPLNDIAFSSDGFLMGCNLNTIAFAGDNTNYWRVYSWADDTAEPSVLLNVGTADYLGNFTSSVAGTTFCVSGQLNDCKIYVTAYSESRPAQYRVAGLQVTGGTIGTFVRNQNSTYTLEGWGRDVQFTISPNCRDNIIIDSPSTQPIEYTFLWDANATPMDEYKSMASGIVNTEATGINYFRFAGKIYCVAPNCTSDLKSASARMYDVTKGINKIVSLTDNFPSSMGEEKIGYLMGAGEVKDGCIYLYLFAQNEGMVKYVIEGEVPDGNTGEVDFKLEKVWSKTVNENNAPDHIDGTNAQQGGAHNGIFYVNDCVDKLVYMFNENGLIGTLPGGTGWGTACDDAGNIIIRNDKSTTTSHSLLIYPSGTSSSTAEAKELTFDLNEAGQTNFISASGDVLGEGGYVYFFPNKQTVVNILKIVNGEVESVKTSENLSITGSTAGYVIPIKNNPENWLYQVRGNGYYLYNGGDKAAFIAGSSSTTAPNRNSTCGGEYFTLSSHDIMIYNSGANYTGGFTIKDITADQVITSVAPIGNKGYTEGGNYSVSNWMFAEKIDAGSYYLYQYCPANGMAVYRFYDANYTSGEEKITDQPKDGKIKIYPNPAEHEIFIESNETVRCADIYNLSGSLVKTVNLENTGNKSINIENLASGIYIVKINKNEKGERFIKK